MNEKKDTNKNGNTAENETAENFLSSSSFVPSRPLSNSSFSSCNTNNESLVKRRSFKQKITQFHLKNSGLGLSVQRTLYKAVFLEVLNRYNPNNNLNHNGTHANLLGMLLSSVLYLYSLPDASSTEYENQITTVEIKEKLIFSLKWRSSW